VDEASSAGTSATAHPAAGPSSRMRDERARSPPPVPAVPERGLRSEAVLDRDGDSFWSLLRVRFTGRSASRYARRAGRRTRSRKAAMFEGFTEERIETSGATIHAVRRGSGPPLLLLHGYPQTHVMWHLVAPGLAEEFTVVAADLRGYGHSSKPPGDPQHAR